MTNLLPTPSAQATNQIDAANWSTFFAGLPAGAAKSRAGIGWTVSHGGKHVSFRASKTRGQPVIERLAQGGAWKRVGFITPNGLRVATGADAVSLKAARFSLALVDADRAARSAALGVSIHGVDRCSCCGKTLTDPQSQSRGVGPKCYGRMTETVAATSI